MDTLTLDSIKILSAPFGGKVLHAFSDYVVLTFPLLKDRREFLLACERWGISDRGELVWNKPCLRFWYY